MYKGEVHLWVECTALKLIFILLLPYPPQPGSLCEDERATLRPWVTIPSPHAVWPPWGPPQAGHLCSPSGTFSHPFPFLIKGKPLCLTFHPETFSKPRDRVLELILGWVSITSGLWFL